MQHTDVAERLSTKAPSAPGACAAKPQAVFLPAGKVSTRHANLHLTSLSVLLTAVFVVPCVTIPEARPFQLTEARGQALESKGSGFGCWCRSSMAPRESRCPRGSQRSHISRRNVDFYATYRRRTASIYGSAAAGGGAGQRQSATTNCTNPTKGMGIL
jgi:hypothetical protein